MANFDWKPLITPNMMRQAMQLKTELEAAQEAQTVDQSGHLPVMDDRCISFEVQEDMHGTVWMWHGRRVADQPYPAEFNPDQHSLIDERYSLTGECLLKWCPKFAQGGVISRPTIDNFWIDGQQASRPMFLSEVMGVPGDSFLTPWTAGGNVVDEAPPATPEVEIMIKYVKHSRPGAKGTTCQGCDAADLVWAHEVLDGVIITGDEEDYCSRCKTTGAMVLIDPKQTPTGKYNLHDCSPEPSSAGAGGQGGEPNDAEPEQGDGDGQAEPSNERPDLQAPEADADPWLDDKGCPANLTDPLGSHDRDASGVCMNCGEGKPEEQDSDSDGDGQSDSDSPPPDNDYVTHPELDACVAELHKNRDSQLHTLLNSQKEYIDRVIDGIETGVRPVQVEIVQPGEPAKPLPGLHHYALPLIIKMAAARLHVLMVGGAGVGKGKMVRQAAEALELPFYALPGSLSPQTPVHALIGYNDSAGNYHTTLYRKAFEEGGVIFLDELDNAHPACMAAANDGLAIQPGEWLAFPDGMVQRHPDFIVVAAANTFGKGPDQNYAARQRGDAATWDRFNIIEIAIDEPLEMTLCSRTGASVEIISEVLRFVRTLRKTASVNGTPIVLGPRASIDMCKMLNVGCTVEEAVNARVRRGMSDQDWQKWTSEVRDINIKENA